MQKNVHHSIVNIFKKQAEQLNIDGVPRTLVYQLCEA